MSVQNYTLGRGKLYFARYIPGTTTPEGERYIGNTPEFSATIETENLDHFSSDGGVKVKDGSVALQTDRSASFTTDNISLANISLFFFGSVSAVVQSAATVTDETFLAVDQDLYYQLGVTETNPSGVRSLDYITADTVKITVEDDKASPTTFDEGADYTIDMDLGRLYVVKGGDIAKGTNLKVTYKTKAVTRDRVISGSRPIEGLLHYIADNPAGENYDWLMPYVKLSPNGEYTLKGDDWQTIPFNVEMLEKPPLGALYIDGRAHVPTP